jgi:hypothetical protein
MLSPVQIILKRTEDWKVNNEFERTWMGAVVVYLKMLSQHFIGGIEDNYNKTQSEVCLSRDLNRVSLEYKSEICGFGQLAQTM